MPQDNNPLEGNIPQVQNQNPSQGGTAPVVPPPPQVVANNAPVASSFPVQPAVSTQETASTTPPPPKKGLPKIFLILGAVLGLAVIALLVFRFLLPMFGGGREKELVWWGLWEDSTIVDSLIKEYEEANPGVKIKYVKQSHKDYRERLTNALAKGEGPDIFRIHNSWVPMFKKELDNVPSSVMSAAEYTQSYYPTITNDAASGAGLVAIPLGYDALTLYINEDIFNENGKTPPTNWDELRRIARELTRKDENEVITQAGVALGRTENVDHWPEILGLMMIQNGVRLTEPTGPLAEDALVFFTIFSSVDGVWDSTLPPSTTAFAAGKVAMYFGPSWRAFEIKQQNPNLKFRTIPLPQLPKDSPDQIDVSYATYWLEGVWGRSKQKEAAWDFLKFVSSKESLQKLYQNAAKVRTFGEPYPRVDMANLLLDHPVAGSIISLAPDSQSWYLADATHDGPTGINSQINKYFEDAINAVNDRVAPGKALEAVASGVRQVLSQYGVISP